MSETTITMLARLAALRIDLWRSRADAGLESLPTRGEIEAELVADFAKYIANCTPQPCKLQLVPPPSTDRATT